ncbi:MAG: dihydroneopterin aldolase [Chitinophagaceae bacterium]|nr:dihydroneopterin aldolase [Chitinophagaceae bacterium]
MLTVHLKNICFHAFHGLYEEERILGNEYEVNLSVELIEEPETETLDQTVDYVSLFTLVEKRMALPTPLLETVAQDLAEMIRLAFTHVRSISISIDKKNPPMAKFRGSVGVTYTRTF